jgi:hypothetical protein
MSVILAGTLRIICHRRHCGVQLIIVSPPPLTLRLKFDIEKMKIRKKVRLTSSMKISLLSVLSSSGRRPVEWSL